MTDERPALHELLQWMVESGASDLHLSFGTPPVFRRNGALESSPSMAPLTHDDLVAALTAVAIDDDVRRLESRSGG
jgi:Tfp pilus assembly pilus retraction ATPase PilT